MHDNSLCRDSAQHPGDPDCDAPAQCSTRTKWWVCSLRRAGSCDSTLTQHIDKIVGVPVRVKHQVPTAPVRGTTDPWSSHRRSTLKGSSMSELRYNTKHQPSVQFRRQRRFQRQQLDRPVVLIQSMYSRRSPSVKLGVAGTERFSRHHEARDHGHKGSNDAYDFSVSLTEKQWPRRQAPSTSALVLLGGSSTNSSFSFLQSLAPHPARSRKLAAVFQNGSTACAPPR